MQSSTPTSRMAIGLVSSVALHAAAMAWPVHEMPSPSVSPLIKPPQILSVRLHAASTGSGSSLPVPATEEEPEEGRVDGRGPAAVSKPAFPESVVATSSEVTPGQSVPVPAGAGMSELHKDGMTASHAPPDASAAGPSGDDAVDSGGVADGATIGETETQPSHTASYLRNPPPRYPRLAQRARIEGTAVIRALVTAAGRCGQARVEVSSGDESLDLAALDAVSAWQFVPASRDGSAVDAWVEIPVEFRLPKGHGRWREPR